MDRRIRVIGGGCLRRQELAKLPQPPKGQTMSNDGTIQEVSQVRQDLVYRLGQVTELMTA